MFPMEHSVVTKWSYNSVMTDKSHDNIEIRRLTAPGWCPVWTVALYSGGKGGKSKSTADQGERSAYQVSVQRTDANLGHPAKLISPVLAHFMATASASRCKPVIFRSRMDWS